MPAPPRGPKPQPPELADAGSSRGVLGGWLLPLAILGVINLVVRQIADPFHQLVFYCGSLGGLLMFERLRVGLPRAQGVVLIGAALIVGISERAAIRAGRLDTGAAFEQMVHLGTGLGSGFVQALRVSALEEQGLGPFKRYVDKVDPRSPEIDILASHLAKGCDSADHLCETASILRFVADEVVYRQDPRGGEDYIKTPQETLAANAGDCEDKSILFISLLESLGNRTFLVFTRDHVWPLVCFDKQLPELWRQRTARLGPQMQSQYLARLGATHVSPDEFARQLDAIDEVEIDGRACYAVEPTAEGSFFGVHHEVKDYLIAVDPIGRKTIDLKKAVAK